MPLLFMPSQSELDNSLARASSIDAKRHSTTHRTTSNCAAPGAACSHAASFGDASYRLASPGRIVEVASDDESEDDEVRACSVASSLLRPACLTALLLRGRWRTGCFSPLATSAGGGCHST